MERLRKKPSENGTKLGAVLTGVVQSSMPFHSSIDGWMGVRMRACVARLKTFDKFDTFRLVMNSSHTQAVLGELTSN